MFKRGEKVVCINVAPIGAQTANLLDLNKEYTVNGVMLLDNGNTLLGLNELKGTHYPSERFMNAAKFYSSRYERNKEAYNDNPSYGLF